ncbi:MAG: hypothetical protein ACI9MC_000983 [Kiritimatiellia bacterium]
MTRSFALMFALACSTPSLVEVPVQTTTAPPPTVQPVQEELPPVPASAPDTPAWVSGTAHEPEPGHAGLIEALGASGACRTVDMEKPLRALEWTHGSHTIYAAMCESYAYQADWEWWRGDDSGMKQLLDAEGHPVRLLGYPQFSPVTGHGSWLTKSRGSGGCGDYYLYQLKDGVFVELEHRTRACDDTPASIPSPSEWPLVP